MHTHMHVHKHFHERWFGQPVIAYPPILALVFWGRGAICHFGIICDTIQLTIGDIWVASSLHGLPYGSVTYLRRSIFEIKLLNGWWVPNQILNNIKFFLFLRKK